MEEVLLVYFRFGRVSINFENWRVRERMREIGRGRLKGRRNRGKLVPQSMIRKGQRKKQEL